MTSKKGLPESGFDRFDALVSGPSGIAVDKTVLEPIEEFEVAAHSQVAAHPGAEYAEHYNYLRLHNSVLS